MRDFCKANNMNFVAIESYEEDAALYNAWGGFDSKNSSFKSLLND